ELRAYTEGMRVLGYWTAHLLDAASQATGDERRLVEQRLGLLTPIIKAFFSDQGFRLSSKALQVFGGYGYTADYAIEQTLRDSRIAMIYEGSNEIQANDLLLRKVLADRGEGLEILLAPIREEARQVQDQDGERLLMLCERVGEQVRGLMDSQDAERPYRVAGDFLALMGVLLMGHVWLRSWRLALGRTDDEFHVRKCQTARFFFDYLLPEADYRLTLMGKGDAVLPFL
ncbi:MAG: acyl-CoA dehydrogenase family protein, partial [Negativicutes bacterium]|nr:acyl-CoA dehydrogenase family protein [Negativicutes bacterium]